MRLCLTFRSDHKALAPQLAVCFDDWEELLSPGDAVKVAPRQAHQSQRLGRTASRMLDIDPDQLRGTFAAW